MHEGIPQLLLAGATLLVAIAALLRVRDKTVERKKLVRIGAMAMAGVSVLLLAWGAFRGWDAMRYFSDAVAAVRDPAGVRSIRVEPIDSLPFDVLDADELAALTDALREATPWSPQGLPPQPNYILTLRTPEAEWKALLHTDRSEGAIVTVLSSGVEGIALAQYRNDDLGKMLSRLTAAHELLTPAPPIEDDLLPRFQPTSRPTPILQSQPRTAPWNVPTTQP